MTLLSFDRRCSEIVAQTQLLRGAIEGADLTRPVPTCPGWNVGQLLRHLGGTHRWAEEMVRTRATGALPDQHYPRSVAVRRKEGAAEVAPWLVEGAELLAETLREAGPECRSCGPRCRTSGRSPEGARTSTPAVSTHETALHRADAVLALGAEYTLDQEVALDGIDEWMALGSLPMHFEVHPWMRELLGPGRTLHFHATDTAPEVAAEWVVDLTGDAIIWRRAHEKAAVAVRGPLTDLLLIIYKRRPARSAGVEILGDEKLLDFWLERVSFG
ncbi:Maleylpyruvate isomerase family mycothiol-dependent enzyme OS=Streptomyces antimycoticus OX=68175 GN=SANT12839_029930 PE=4 SV=1 [Streptomyces antimycoticus]